MVLTINQQLHQLLENSQHVLLVFGQDKNPDAIAAALAMQNFLQKQFKQADIVSGGFSVPGTLKFLPGIGQIKPTLEHLQKFIIKVDVSKTNLDTISYDVKDGNLAIYLTPRQGILTKNELRTAQSSFKYDLIITFGVRDLESLGEIYHNNTDLFYRVPVVNFDQHPGNEHFGQINIVELTATSTCEVLYNYLVQLGEAYLDEHIATAILTGMISGTKSFKTPNVTPLTLNLASKLMAMGADRDLIVQNLYRTRTLSTLKLWGEVLSHLEHDSSSGAVWAKLPREIFLNSGAREEDLKEVVTELITNSPEAKIIILFYEQPQNFTEIRGLIHATKNFDALELVRGFNATGDKILAEFKLTGKTLKEAEEEVMNSIKKTLQN